MNKITIPEGTPLLVSEGEKLYVSKEIVELAMATKNDVWDILTQIPVGGVKRSEDFFRKYEIGNYGEDYEVISKAGDNIDIEIREENN
ncbi:MAG: hypothetical protein WC850_00505 [Candidatus Gracilibacteria bacterium]